jgi:O-antigen ligase
MLDMLEQAIARKHIAPERWKLLVSLCALAVLLGIVIGREQWLYLPVIALVPLLFFWPVEIALGALAMLVPFEHIAMMSQRALATFALVLAVCVLCGVGLLSARLQPPSTAAKWWALFLAWTMASTLWAIQPEASLAILHLVPMFLIFYLAASTFRISEKEFNWIMSASILAGGAAAILSIYEFYNGMIIASHQVRATLVAGDIEANPNRFAIRLLLPLSFAIARVVSARQWWSRLIALAFMALLSWALILTMSRGTLLAAAVIVLVFVLRTKLLRRRIALIALTAVVLAAATPEGLVLRLKNSATDRGAGRLDIWTVGLTALEHRPVMGAGFNNFSKAYTEYAGYAPHFTKIANDAHNIYLAISVEEGIVGLVLFLIALKMQFSTVSKYRSPVEGTRIMLVSCEAAFCAVLVAGFFGTIIWDKTFWFSLVCLVLATTFQSNNGSPQPAFIRGGQSK